MRVIGITGGVGSGKSRVLTFLQERFFAVICQADHVAWELQMPGEECHRQIVTTFGNQIINEDGTINRNVLGQIVFADGQKLRALNEIMHPQVKKRILERLENEKVNGTKLFVIEAALLLEDHYDEICDDVWYIYTEPTVRAQRLKDNRSYSDEKIASIMNRQLSDEIFRKHCRVIIDNSGDFSDTCYQIEQAMKR